ncbi:hypothetical protein FACS1894216_10830 [Synergistales bacterium]|nr:hypothetical protein FACS1894216_10830 [Synergistales bacterium]
MGKSIGITADTVEMRRSIAFKLSFIAVALSLDIVLFTIVLLFIRFSTVGLLWIAFLNVFFMFCWCNFVLSERSQLRVTKEVSAHERRAMKRQAYELAEANRRKNG